MIDCFSAAVIVIFFFAFWCAAPTWVRCCTARLLCFLIVGNQASGISIYSVAHVPVDVVIVKSYHDLQSNLLVRTPLYYGQFSMSRQNSHIFSLKKKPGSIIRTRGVTIHIPCDSIRFRLLPFDFDSIM